MAPDHTRCVGRPVQLRPAAAFKFLNVIGQLVIVVQQFNIRVTTNKHESRDHKESKCKKRFSLSRCPLGRRITAQCHAEAFLTALRHASVGNGAYQEPTLSVSAPALGRPHQRWRAAAKDVLARARVRAVPN